MSGAVLARAGTVLVAVLVLAWLGVMERDDRLAARGLAAVQHDRDPAALARADADLRGAGRLNPDTTPDITRALGLRRAGDAAKAVALVEDVLRREPDNLQAWGLLATLSAGRDAAAVRRALAARQRLDPVNARRR